MAYRLSRALRCAVVGNEGNAAYNKFALMNSIL